MKITFPHMGNMWIGAKAILEGLGLDVVVPPFCTRETLDLGLRHAPEFICLPLKLNLGNYIQAAALGADAIVMAGGVGPCRFGYYCRLEKEIIDDLGLGYEMVVLEPPQGKYGRLFAELRKLGGCGMLQAAGAIKMGWLKCCLVDLIEIKVQSVRAWESRIGTADRIYRMALAAMDTAETRKQAIAVKKEALEALEAVETEPEREAVRIGIIGEIYTVLEPFANLDAEKHLGAMGAEIKRSLYVSRWVNDHLLQGILPLPGTREECRLSSPYLNYFVGGHGRETVGGAVHYARTGVDGILQIAPLTCGPEIVAEAILPRVAEKEGVPVMTIYMDELTGEAGVVTRLEAFVDMVRRRKYLRWGARKEEGHESLSGC